jgi:hypothetical protein
MAFRESISPPSDACLELAFHIVRAKRNMMDAARGIFQIFWRWTFRVRGFQQFKMDFAHTEERRPHLCDGTSSRRSHFQTKRLS